jgi:integrase
MQQINSHVYIGCVSIPLSMARAEYLLKYDAEGLSEGAYTQAELTLRQLADMIGDPQTGSLKQSHFAVFVALRMETCSRWTVNKDIGCLTAFLNWAADPGRRYITQNIKLKKVKAPPITVTALTNDQIRSLIERAPSDAWRVRLLISLTTGIRKADVDSLRVADVDLDTRTIRAVATKTSKPLTAPWPDKLEPVIAGYIESLEPGQTRLFADRNVRKVWDGFRSGVTRQDLRKTFSTLMQLVGSISTAKDLLQHSSARTTEQFYSDRDMIARWKVNRLPVEKWL